MDVWQLGLYVAAALLALRSLVSLMSHHRRQHRRRLTFEQQAETQHNRTTAPEGSQPSDPENAENTGTAA